MLGYNILGLNTHSDSFHKKASLASILEGASKDLDSFKEVEEAIKSLESKIDNISLGDGTSLSDYIKKEEAADLYQEKGEYLTEHQDLSDYAKKSDIPETKDFLTSNDLPDYSDVYLPKGEYLTEHQDISNLATKDELFSGKYSDLEGTPDFDTLINTAVSTEIAKLTEGASSNFDTFKEISDWISTHGTTAETMIGAINDHAKNIGALEEKVETLKNANYVTMDSFEKVILTAETETGETITFTLAGISKSE